MPLITEGLVIGIGVFLILVPAAAAIVAGRILLHDAWRARRRATVRAHEVDHG